jgi:hypothetical protein
MAVQVRLKRARTKDDNTLNNVGLLLFNMLRLVSSMWVQAFSFRNSLTPDNLSLTILAGRDPAVFLLLIEDSRDRYIFGNLPLILQVGGKSIMNHHVLATTSFITAPFILSTVFLSSGAVSWFFFTIKVVDLVIGKLDVLISSFEAKLPQIYGAFLYPISKRQH